jgi:hypothetical protein
MQPMPIKDAIRQLGDIGNEVSCWIKLGMRSLPSCTWENRHWMRWRKL